MAEFSITDSPAAQRSHETHNTDTSILAGLSMAVLLGIIREPPRPCSYLDATPASLVRKKLLYVSPAELDAMLERGWRRFGSDYFRPACSPCRECVSLRLPVDRFAPSRQQRRVARRCASLDVVVGPVIVDAERVSLHARWYAERERTRGWEASPLDAEGYARQFGFPHPCAREVAYYDGPRLVGVGLCDETARAWSAAYFFYDPAYADRSLGVFHVLTLVRLARERARPHVYLGFRVEGCASMRYKARFRPHELLSERPSMDETPLWIEGPRADRG
jgi:arginine-tRNA-protein transferase